TQKDSLNTGAASNIIWMHRRPSGRPPLFKTETRIWSNRISHHTDIKKQFRKNAGGDVVAPLKLEQPERIPCDPAHVHKNASEDTIALRNRFSKKTHRNLTIWFLILKSKIFPKCY